MGRQQRPACPLTPAVRAPHSMFHKSKHTLSPKETQSTDTPPSANSETQSDASNIYSSSAALHKSTTSDLQSDASKNCLCFGGVGSCAEDLKKQPALLDLAKNKLFPRSMCFVGNTGSADTLDNKHTKDGNHRWPTTAWTAS